MEEHERQSPRASDFEQRWLCIGNRRWQLPAWLHLALSGLLAVLHRLFPARMRRDVWIRYRRGLPDSPGSDGVILTPMSEDIVERLRHHPLRGRDQMRSGIRLWQQGLHNAFIWLEEREPLCMQWLFMPSDNERLQNLPEWSDLYLPLPQDAGHAENIFTFPRGLRRRGGAATEFALAVFGQARAAGLQRLYTHTHEHNLGARRWAERTGWEPYGAIRRYHLDLPLLRQLHWCLHSVETIPPLPGAHPRPQVNGPDLACDLSDELQVARLAGR